jgi:hypothetical protein
MVPGRPKSRYRPEVRSQVAPHPSLCGPLELRIGALQGVQHHEEWDAEDLPGQHRVVCEFPQHTEPLEGAEFGGGRAHPSRDHVLQRVDLCKLVVLPDELNCTDVVWRSVWFEIPEELRCQLSSHGH